MPEGYTLSIAFACMLEVVKSLDSLVQLFHQPVQRNKVEGWIEPGPEQTADKNSTGVGTDFIKATADDVESEKGEVFKPLHQE